MLSAGAGAGSTLDALEGLGGRVGVPGRRLSLHRAVVYVFIGDCIALLVAGLAPIWIHWFETGSFSVTMSSEVVVSALCLFLACQYVVGAYKRRRILAKGQSIRRTVFSLLTTFSLLFMAAAAFKVTSDYSRLWFFSWMVVSVFSITLLRFLVLERLRSELAAGGYVYRAASLGLGSSPLTEKEIDARSSGGTRIFAARSLGSADELSQLDELVREQDLDEVYISVPWEAAPQALAVLGRQKHVPANVHVCLLTANDNLPFLGAVVAEGKIRLKVLDRPIDGWASLSKRAMDLAVAGLALALLWPLMLIVAVAIKLESRGPVIFRQPRQGFNGRTFEVMKFRSMRVESTDLLSERQTSRGDARVTRVGRFIRRTSIDELPQLFNVMRGEMSVVGPRPHALKTTAEGQSLNTAVLEYAMRHRVKPGLTGWAQVNGLRGELDSIEKLRRRVQHDIDYIKNWSIAFDLGIIGRTLILVLRDRSAY